MKLTFEEMANQLWDYNELGKKPLLKVKIVLADSNWPGKYSEQSRTYFTDSDQKAFRKSISYSIWADCADGSEHGVRLDWYMKPFNPSGWDVEYCEIVGEIDVSWGDEEDE